MNVRKDFKILQQTVRNLPLTYLDNGASTQKPEVVLQTMSDYYHDFNSNIHRGVHYLSQKATSAFEEARKTVQDFIHARHAREIIFTKGTTESINLVASSFQKSFLKPGDSIAVTIMEHHANFVPWQQICLENQGKFIVAPIHPNGELIEEELFAILRKKPRLLAITHVSNVLGTINPLKEIIREAHRNDCLVLVDAAQSIAHMPLDVQDLDCDFLAFSGHKMYGPMGVGVLYGKEELLNALPPYQFGGEMIQDVSIEKTTFNELPYKFETGTPAVAEVLGLKTAVEYLRAIGFEAIETHEKNLLEYTENRLRQLQGIRIIGEAPQKSGIISFLIDGCHPYDVGVILDQLGIAVRTGHHCAQPLIDFYRIPGTVRAGFSVYNNLEDADRLINAVEKAGNMLR